MVLMNMLGKQLPSIGTPFIMFEFKHFNVFYSCSIVTIKTMLSASSPVACEQKVEEMRAVDSFNGLSTNKTLQLRLPNHSGPHP